ncbi:MAG TPA: glycosyltransferase [Xanthobacteraceae bacterium]|jgi:hypothetical protein
MGDRERPLRILEIGEDSIFKRSMPRETTLIFTGASSRSVDGLEYRAFGPTIIPGLLRSLKRGEWDVVFCFPPARPLLDSRRAFAGLPAALSRVLFRFRTLGTYAARTRYPIPLVVLDLNDMITVPRPAMKLLDRSIVYFKRDLPMDPAKALFDVVPRFRTPRKVMSSKFFLRNADKFRPISVGVSEDTARLALATREEKSVDIFFAGRINSAIRQRGFEQLKALAAAGYSVDICQGGLSKTEYLERCARAWLTWSPEGFGWGDCFRHFEASLCQSVPVTSPPSVLRYRPLIDGVHTFVYPLEDSGLSTVVTRALQDKFTLAEMGRNAREHVLAYHTHDRVCEHVLDIALDCIKAQRHGKRK